jgi:hemolysin activation/secretion protein
MSGRGFSIAAFTGIAIIANLSCARAQVVSPSQVTPQSLRPEPLSSEPSITEPGLPAAAPLAGKTKLTVLIREVRVDGSFPELAWARERLISELQGCRSSVERISTTVESLEQAYIRSGYPLARVVLPQQELVDRGTLRIQVIDGFIDSVDVSALPQRVRNLVAKRVAPLIGRRHVRQVEIERILLLAGGVPGLQLRSTLARGSRDGGVRLILDGEYKLVSTSAGADNRLASSLGIWQVRGSVSLNNALGFGEQIYGTGGSGANLVAAAAGYSPLQLFGVGAVIPVGTDGLTINPEYTHSVTRTDHFANVPASLGAFERFALRLREPLVLTRTDSLYANVSLEDIDQRMAVPDFAALLNHDHYQVLRMGPDYLTALSWGSELQLGGLISAGLAGRSNNDAVISGVPLSRQGASAEFAKLTGSAHLAQPLPFGLRLDVLAAGQYTDGKPMLLPEQLALDGNDAITAFASGTFTADEGATLRSELSRPLAAQLESKQVILSPYLFGAIGRGWLANATVVEQAGFNAAAVGVGVRTNLDTSVNQSGLKLALEVARGFTNLVGVKQGWRGNAIASVAF